MKRGPEDKSKIELINFLGKKAKENKAPIWRAVAEKLKKPRRKRVEVSINKISKYLKENEIAVVPGKVIGSGYVNNKMNIAAYKFSKGVKEKIEKVGGRCINIKELVESNPKGSGVKIIG